MDKDEKIVVIGLVIVFIMAAIIGYFMFSNLAKM
jgi:hypothetical protein